MAYRVGDEITPGYEISQPIGSGPLSERYVVHDAHGVSYEIELVPVVHDGPLVNQIAYRSLAFIAGVRHQCLPESQGTIAIPFAESERHTTYREVPLWEHPEGGLSLAHLVESIGPLHPAQAIETIIGASAALMAADRASRNSTGNPFPHLALSPTNIALRENRVPVVLGWANRAAFLSAEKPALGQNRYLAFIDPVRPALEAPDRRHDVFALGASLFFLLKGSPPPSFLRSPGGAEELFIDGLAPIVGAGTARGLARALAPAIAARPSLEVFVRMLLAARSEVDYCERGTWSMCSGCGLLMQRDPDLCPLCIRDRIQPTTHIAPAVIDAPQIPPPLAVPPYGEADCLEDVPATLCRGVREAAAHKGRAELERMLQHVIRALVERGFREFVGDLLREDGQLTNDAYWVAVELAHRINGKSAEDVELAREKGAFLRWLRGRERSFRFRKSLRMDVPVEDERVDFVFRGRAYVFVPEIKMPVWHRVNRIMRVTGLHVVVVALRGDGASVPPGLVRRVTVYTGSPPRRTGRRRFWGGLDEYRFFAFVRGRRDRRRSA
jgi:hypothetical protein